MEKQYLLSADQSTRGTKAPLFDREGNLICGGDLLHWQIINDVGWVSHDLNGIYADILKVIRGVIEKVGICREQVAGLGISNQRETSAVRDRMDGHLLADAIVWQCSRAEDICAWVEESRKAEWVRRTAGINLSPFSPASKLAWFMEDIKKMWGMKVGVCFFLGGGGAVKGIRGEARPGDRGQGCLEKGMIKTTYGTGSFIMMSIDDKPIISTHGVTTSLAWGVDGRVNYALEGNISAPEDRDLIIHEMRIDCAPEELDQVGEHSFYCGVMDLHFGSGTWRISCHPLPFDEVHVSGLPFL